MNNITRRRVHIANAAQPLRRKRKETLELEHVLGFTTSKNNAFAIHPSEDIIAYLAGCVVVLYNIKRNRQIAHLVATATYVPAAAAESQQTNNAPRGASSNDKKPKEIIKTGHHPRILVWEITTGNLIAEMQSHRFGVLSVCFSPNNKYLVTLGFQHDGFLCVWNWKQGVKLASNKISTKVHALAFAVDGSFCVTAGLRCIKFWYFDAQGNLPPSKTAGVKSHVKVLEGRMGVLGDLKNHCFVDAACGRGPDGAEYTYLVTSNGLLCLFIKGRILDRWIDLQVKSANAIHVSNNLIVCGCSDGIVRLFEPVTLNYIGTVPKPFNLCMELELDSKPDILPDDVFPDAFGVRLNADGDKICSVYSDRSMLVWEVKEEMRVIKMRSFLYHSDVVWGAEMVPAQLNAPSEQRHHYPDGTFVTYSSDGTVRFWNWNNLNQRFTIFDDKGKPLKRMGLSKELLQVHYMDPEWKKVIKDRKTGDAANATTTDQVVGVRTLKLSRDGIYLATGDRLGNLRVHTLKNFELQVYHEAHDAEIMTLDFSHTPMFMDYPYMLTSAGRDRLVHIFDIRNKFALLQTLDDHSSSILSVLFTDKGKNLVSLGLDKSIIFRNTTFQKDATPFYNPYHIHSDRLTMYEMDLDEFNEQLAVVTQNRCVSIFDVATGKQTISHKSNVIDDPSSPDGSLIHVKLDPSASFAVTAGTDKRIRLVDLSNGACLAVQGGHSEMITSVRFTDDCKRVVSTAADGCVFLWKVDKQIAATMRSRHDKLMEAKQTQDQADLEAYIAQSVAAEESILPQGQEVTAAEREDRVKRTVKDILTQRSRLDADTSQPSLGLDISEIMGDDADSSGSLEESEPEEEEIESTDKNTFKVTQTPRPTKQVLLSINEEDVDESMQASSAVDSDEEMVGALPFIRSSFHDYLEPGPASIFTPRNRNSISANYLMTVKVKQGDAEVTTKQQRRRSAGGLSSIVSSGEESQKSPRSPSSPAHSPTHARAMRRGPNDSTTIIPDNDLSLIVNAHPDVKTRHRRSLSSPHQDVPSFAQPTHASLGKVNEGLPPPPRSSSVSSATVARRKASNEQLDKKREMQAEVERTRQRLAQLGLYQPNPPQPPPQSSQKVHLNIPPPPRRRRSRTDAADLSEPDRAKTPDATTSPTNSTSHHLPFSIPYNDCIHCTLGSSNHGHREASLLNRVRELRSHLFHALQEYSNLTDGSHPTSNEQQSILNLIKDDFMRMRQDVSATLPESAPAAVSFNVVQEQPKDFTHTLLENYSDLLVNLVQEKLAKLQ